MDKLREKTDQKLQKIEKKIQDNPRKTAITLLTLTILTATTTALLTLPVADNIIQKKNLSEDLVLHYNFESGNTEKVIDRSGNNHTGIIHGDPRYVRGQEKGLQMEFDKSDFLTSNLDHRLENITLYVDYSSTEIKQEEYVTIAGLRDNWWLYATESSLVWRNDYSGREDKMQLSVEMTPSGNIFASNDGETQSIIFNGKSAQRIFESNLENEGNEFIVADRTEGKITIDEIKLYNTKIDGGKVKSCKEEICYQFRFRIILTFLLVLGVVIWSLN